MKIAKQVTLFITVTDYNCNSSIIIAAFQRIFEELHLCLAVVEIGKNLDEVEVTLETSWG